MKVMLHQDEFYPVLQITTYHPGEQRLAWHEVELTDDEMKQYSEAMDAYYDCQAMLQDKWDARYEQLEEIAHGPKDAQGNRYSLKRESP